MQVDLFLGSSSCKWIYSWIVLRVNGFILGSFFVEVHLFLESFSCKWIHSWIVLCANTRFPGGDDIKPHPATEDPSEIIST